MKIVATCRRLAASSRFDAVMLGVIALNAVVIGAETYDGVLDRYRSELHLLDKLFLAAFSFELLVRIVATWPSPREFWKSPWNVFDFVVVVASFVPGLNATVLRLLRLARVGRAVRFLPDLKVIVGAIGRAVPGVASLAVATLLLVYLFGMIGWLIFHTHDPDNFGNVGQAMVTMFVLLTLENLPTYIEKGQELSDATIIFFVSYVLIASFLVFNLFIGIVLNSMEGAREEEARRERARERAAAEQSADHVDDAVVALEDRIDDLRGALDTLQEELKLARETPA